ncbi:extracellular solute-binding protein [Oculatella sp. LEGE 06141]|nr:extracellular solute-binding protein [Oculatella sp. LEGE 06141]
MHRRSLLLGAGALLLNQLLAGCGAQGRDAALKIRMLDGSIPAQLVREFQRRLEQRVPLNVLAQPQLSDLFDLLQRWNPANDAESRDDRSGLPFSLPFTRSEAPSVADLITLGDFWLTSAIQQGLIQPLEIDTLSGWEQLPANWQAFVRRDRQGQLAETGDIWAAPYRWGTLMMAYSVEAFEDLGWAPTDWDDLWRPELRGYLSLPDSPRSVIGLVLKRLGQSVNAADIASLPELNSELRQLHQQVKVYSSDAYLQPLLLGDTWIAVGWSTDILPVIERDRRIAAVVPESGTILTSDLWVRPATAPPPTATNDGLANLPQRWIDFCWQPQIASQISLLSLAASPVLLGSDRNQLPHALRDNPLLLPSRNIIEQSEFFEPLASETLNQYHRQWVAVRQRD